MRVLVTAAATVVWGGLLVYAAHLALDGVTAHVELLTRGLR